MSDAFKLGLAGLGTVGTGVLRLLDDNADLLSARAGRPIEVVAVSARTRGRDRGIDLSGYQWCDDPADLAQVEGLDAVIDDLTVAEVPDCGHFVPWEAPLAVNDAIESFLARTA